MLTKAQAGIVTDVPSAYAEEVAVGAYVQYREDLGRAYVVSFTLAKQLQSCGARYVPYYKLSRPERNAVLALFHPDDVTS
jgi:hypothetical protein